MSNVDSIGIMDPAFFVGKRILLEWVNDFFELNYTKVEEAATGALHCQILDCIYSGQVPLHKVNFDAKYDYDFVKNFKVLQDVFNKQKINKHVPVEKLVKAKYQDNLEFLQWMKHFFEQKYNGEEYNAKWRRDNCKKKNRRLRGKAAEASANAAPKRTAKATKRPIKTSTAGTSKPSKPVKPVKARPAKATRPAKSSVKQAELAALNEKLLKFQQTVEGLQKERDFYFCKLREIELLCQDGEEEGETIEKAAVLTILYKTDDDDFQPPEEGEEEEEEEAVDDEAY